MPLLRGLSKTRCTKPFLSHIDTGHAPAYPALFDLERLFELALSDALVTGGRFTILAPSEVSSAGQHLFTLVGMAGTHFAACCLCDLRGLRRPSSCQPDVHSSGYRAPLLGFCILRDSSSGPSSLRWFGGAFSMRVIGLALSMLAGNSVVWIQHCLRCAPHAASLHSCGASVCSSEVCMVGSRIASGHRGYF